MQAKPNFIVPLSDVSAGLSQVGGKGASLARLAAAGLPVPPGFHLTTAAYRRFVAEHGLQEQILAAVSAATLDQPATLEEASSRIEKLFAQSAMSDELAGAIRRAYTKLGAYAELGGGDVPVAVRSSATAEDLPEMSFAGQQETYLNMRGEAMVLDAVKRCWASLWTARAIGYRARHNIAPQDVSLAVVVQILVPADAAGILFTANPLTGARSQMMINAAWGLGEAIVGGHVTPDTVVVDKASGRIVERKIGKKDVMTIRTLQGTREEPVPKSRRNKAVLRPAQAAELARIGARIEDIYGQPMDIEWALHDGRISIVQARPITALPAYPTEGGEPPLEWKSPYPKPLLARGSSLDLLPDTVVLR
jgi:phosphoenolpyruvate synthase/pyruvate phosphate dikinase